MGIDLKIVVSHFRERRGELLATASLRAERDPRLLSLFSKDASHCLVAPVPEGLKVGHHEDNGLKFDDCDRYGQRLTFTTPEQIRAIERIEDLGEWNRAILAFLMALPAGTRIILYWC